MTPAGPAPRGPGGYADAVRRLGGAQKSQAGVPLYTRYVNRRLGRHAAAGAFVLGLTPNQVTVLSAACSAVAVVLTATVAPSVWLALTVTALLVAGYALDSADGQLARLTGTGGPSGEWLDHVVDGARNPALHFAILISLYRFADVPAWTLLLPLLFALTTTTRFFAQMLAEQLRRREEPGRPGTETDGGQRGRSVIQLPSDPGVINLVFLLLAWPQLFVGVYAALLGMNIVLALASLVRRFREMQHLGGASRRTRGDG